MSIAMEMEVEIPAQGLDRAAFLAKLRSWEALVQTFARMMGAGTGAAR